MACLSGGRGVKSLSFKAKPIPVRNLDYSKIKITPKGIAVVENHVSRFGNNPENNVMINRLKDISAGKVQVTDFDKAFYSHELREFVRYRQSGYPTGPAQGSELFYDLYREHHDKTLMDYRLFHRGYEEKIYHPDATKHFKW